jgi:hypothetical protein
MTLSPGPSPRHFRALARRSVSLSAMLRPKAGALVEPAWLVDLGLGGAGAQLAEIIPVGTAVSVSLSAPQLWDPLEIDGTILWLREEEERLISVGIRFHHRAPATLRALSELLEAMFFA